MKKRIVILIMVIVVFLAGGAFLGHFMSSKLNKGVDIDIAQTVVENGIKTKLEDTETIDLEKESEQKSEGEPNVNISNNVVEKKEEGNFKDLFKETLLGYSDKAGTVYTICDIEKDGIPELIIRTGNYEAEYSYSFYRYNDSKVEELGEMSGGHTSLYKMNGQKYIMAVYAHMGYESTYYVYIENNKLVINENSQREIGAQEEYVSGDEFLELKDITDLSLIENY